ncbi:hypothetical protein CHLNCDRAFT_138081 [Chlorella variabilis]|uniref:DUF155 domain-containing protein n=1 Tax=Chlorella variabilis TaxID=554065 RepID=E1Z578_CHLVA|nr:hypothetical protein CHLNCDRAFT_138081 [Chlorella variabilis]EFN59183.1 hypothetical protein CHLNCDRAFT_138081 [Chlorella variabilis]|eukprot:XP_005851285.1 hypothetical protein CHLNCDRAFT_138081 [Chlorella variabilis]
MERSGSGGPGPEGPSTSGGGSGGTRPRPVGRGRAQLPLPGVPLTSAQLRKNRDKLVALLEEGQLSALEVPTINHSPRDSLLGEDELLSLGAEDPAVIGRITIYCTANSYDLKGLREHLESSGHTCEDFPEVLFTRYVTRTGEVAGDVCFFDFGVACFWNLSPAQETSILEQSLKPYEEGKLSRAKVERDTFAFRMNDLLTLSPTMADLHLMKLSISFALSQSTKLSVLEERALSIAEVTRKLPIALAREGKVRISDKVGAVAKLMGRVFIEQASLNLLGSVLDTPDYFWEAGVGDHMQSVYDKVFDYLEMEDRIEVLNARLGLLHELLDMLRLQGQAQHSDFLEVIVIVLICVDVVILLAQVAATLGAFGFDGEVPAGLRGWGSVAALLGSKWA